MARTGLRRNQFTGPARPSTPSGQSHEAHEASLPAAQRQKINEHWYQYETPQKAQVCSIAAWEDSKPFNERQTRREIFKHCEVSEREGYEILREGTLRRHHNDPTKAETRGSKHLLSEEDISKLEKLVWENGFEGRTMTWEALAEEAGVRGRGQEYISGKTVQRALGQKSWRHCIACRKSYVSPEHAKRRQKWAKDMKAKYPLPSDWHRVRFSDEVHFSFGPQGRLYILRRPGERNCPDCIQETEQPKNKKRKRDPENEPELDLGYKLHAWAAIGYNFKSELVFYDAGNSNGKMNLVTYRDLILEPIVKPWLDRKDDFVLEEDGDSGHGFGKGQNLVRIWKEKNQLEYYCNCAGSPDFAIIENGWQVPKQHVKKHPHFDLETLKELALEGWEKLSQKTIKKWVDEMPQRLQDCIDAEGKMTGY